MRATRRCCSHRAMTHPLPSDSSGQRAGRAGHEVARKIADGTSRSSEHERFQRYLSLGTPAVTTRGMKEPEMAAVADMISEVLMDLKNTEAIAKVRQRVHELTARFPLPY